MAEVKYNYQNIKVSFNKSRFNIRNYGLFSGTKDYDCEIILLKNGEEYRKLITHFDVGPDSEKSLPIPEPILACIREDEISDTESTSGYNGTGFGRKAEYSILIKFRLNKDTLYASKGYEIAYGQSIPSLVSFASNDGTNDDKDGSVDIDSWSLENETYRVTHGKGNLGIRGNDFEIQFCGLGLTSYKKCGRELIEGFPAPAFWRAPTDNDRGNRMAQRCAQWKLADMYARITGFDVSEKDGRVLVTYTYTFPTVPEEKCTVQYFVDFDGRIDVELSSSAGKKLGSMPVFGMRFKFNADFDRLTWYGYGPGESYSDRSHGNPLGIHRSTVSQQLSRYLVPQECGNKIGVRNAKVLDSKGRGILFTSCPDAKGSGRYVDKQLTKELAGTFEFQALPCTTHELENAMHATELPPAHFTNVRIALAQLGVGGDDSWGAPTHEEYYIDVKKPLTLRFSMKAV